MKNWQRNLEMRDDILSSVGTQKIDTSGQQMVDKAETEFHRGKRDVNIYTVPQSGLDTPFFPSSLNNCPMRSMAKNPIPTK